MKKRGDTQANKNPKPNRKGKKPPNGWGQIFNGALAELSSHSWLQNFLIGVALLLIWPLIGATVMRTYRATIVGFGIGATLLVWIVVIVLLRQTSADDKPPETELSGSLIPANDPDPPFPPHCERPPDTWGVVYGSSVNFSTLEKMSVVNLHGQELLSVSRTDEGLSISAKVFSADGRIIAEIDKNDFTINQNNFFKRQRPDKSTLIVYDQYDAPVLSVRYLNPSTVRVKGVFRYGDAMAEIDDDVARFRPGAGSGIGIMTLSRSCTVDLVGIIK